MTGQYKQSTQLPDKESVRRRYPGLHSFGFDRLDEQMFFGRERESKDITQRLRANRLLVLYGISGLGKTSLLQAGVFPRLDEYDLLPLRVRFDQADLNPLERLVTDINKEVLNLNANALPDEQFAIDESKNKVQSWWEYFKTSAFWCGDRIMTPVVILDQFEEVFTLQSHDARAEIARQLGCLVNGNMPDYIKQGMRDGKYSYSDESPDVRIVLSLRIEYVGRLQELFSDIPSILNRRFILTPLVREQAQKAISEPAQKNIQGVEFFTGPFRYGAPALEHLLDFLADEESGAVEPYQLQIQCQEIEDKVHKLQANSDDVVVDVGLIGDQQSMRNVVKQFYMNSIDELNHVVSQQKKLEGRTLSAGLSAKRTAAAARELCEFGLLSDAGHRLTLPQEQILDQFSPLTETDLSFLVDRRLLRREAKRASFVYELAHDSLCDPVFENRPYRLSRKARRATMVLAVTGLMLITAIAGFAWYQARQAHEFSEQARLSAEQAQQLAVQEKEALSQALNEERSRKATSEVAQSRIEDLTDRIRELEEALEMSLENNLLLLDKNEQIDRALKEARELASNQTELQAKLESVQEQTKQTYDVLEQEQTRGALTKGDGNSTIKEPEMVHIAGGSFQMGSQATRLVWAKTARPVHTVSVKPFAMSKYEVTFDDYDVFAVETGRQLPDDEGWGRGARPVINVNWEDAQAYTQWVSEQTGKHFRLPSEAEWEYAARSGSKSAYWWGDEIGDGNANCRGCSGDLKNSATLQVGSFKANQFGLYDTVGNVKEWVRDCWHDNYSNAPENGKAWLEANSGDCFSRVVRGGGWADDPVKVHSATRGSNEFQAAGYDIGFRLSQELE